MIQRVSNELVNTYDALLEQIQLPISFDEAMVLVQIFPENAFYDLQWSLLKLVESVCVDDERKYIQLINSCPSQEWRGHSKCSLMQIIKGTRGKVSS